MEWPSFTSASLNSEMAFKKNSRLIIHTREDKGHGLYIKPEWSKYHKKEKEILFSCYSKYSRRGSVQRVSNVNIVQLDLLDKEEEIKQESQSIPCARYGYLEDPMDSFANPCEAMDLVDRDDRDVDRRSLYTRC